MKIRTWLSNDFNKFVSNSGNGKKVPQFELNEKTNLLQIKKDKDGNRVYHDLYDDIQKFKDVNSLERVLKLAQDGDIDNLDFRCVSAKEAKKRSVDYTKFQDVEKVKDLENRLSRSGLTLDDLSMIIQKRVDDYNAKIKKQKDLKVDNKQVENKEVKENEQKDKK